MTRSAPSARRAGNGGYDRLHHGAHEFEEACIGHIEREERRHGLLYLMPQTDMHAQSFALGRTAGGDGDTVEIGLKAIGKREVQRGVGVAADVRQTMTATLSHTEAHSKACETRDDALRILRCREHTLVALRDKWHALTLEPVVHIGVREAFQQPLHELVPARISLAGVADECERVGEIAASAAGYRHLGEHGVVLLEYGDVGIGVAAFRLDGGKEACRTATDDGNV